MKKLFLAIFLILCTNTLFGQDLPIFDDFGLEVLPLRYEFDISEGVQLNHEFSIGLMNDDYPDPLTDLLFGPLFLRQALGRIFNVGGVDVLPIKYEFDISEGVQLNHEFSIGLINYYFENSKTGLGFDTRFIIPKYYYNFHNHVISFFGLNIYWNIFSLIDSNKRFINHSILGPCFSFDYLNWNLSEPFITMFYNYNFKIGIRYFSLNILNNDPEWRFFTPNFTFEAGYKNTNGINSIYLSIHTQMLLDFP
ncbi:MAG: hypothetical protein LBI28_12285 [Treponema sp.]|jgi:hypothetical protein|nr:hypothetical protein [Treponema sp.]